MSLRDNAPARCAACQMHATLCICGLVPRLATRTRLTLLVHYREARKPSNTGRLAARCLERSTVEVIGRRGRPLEEPRVSGGEQPLLLFPDDDALPIAAYAGCDRPIALFVP